MGSHTLILEGTPPSEITHEHEIIAWNERALKLALPCMAARKTLGDPFHGMPFWATVAQKGEIGLLSEW